MLPACMALDAVQNPEPDRVPAGILIYFKNGKAAFFADKDKGRIVAGPVTIALNADTREVFYEEGT